MQQILQAMDTFPKKNAIHCVYLLKQFVLCLQGFSPTIWGMYWWYASKWFGSMKWKQHYMKLFISSSLQTYQTLLEWKDNILFIAAGFISIKFPVSLVSSVKLTTSSTTKFNIMVSTSGLHLAPLVVKRSEGWLKWLENVIKAELIGNYRTSYYTLTGSACPCVKLGNCVL